MSKRFAKKQKACYRIAMVSVGGRTWDFEVPGYLMGKLEDGDRVVVETETGMRIGLVAHLKAHSEHRDENVHMIVDKVREKRYRRLRRNKSNVEDLLAAASDRARKLEAIAGLKELERDRGDEELAKLLDAARSLSDDLALA